MARILRFADGSAGHGTALALPLTALRGTVVFRPSVPIGSKGPVASTINSDLVFKNFLLTDGTPPTPAIRSPPAMLSCRNNVEWTHHAAARMLFHHGSDTRTIAACVRGLQGSRERWTAPTIMDGPDEFYSALERVKYRRHIGRTRLLFIERALTGPVPVRYRFREGQNLYRAGFRRAGTG